jgi:hypothetical protein
MLLSGIRAGFAGVRFPEKTALEFQANEARINAKPSCRKKSCRKPRKKT